MNAHSHTTRVQDASQTYPIDRLRHRIWEFRDEERGRDGSLTTGFDGEWLHANTTSVFLRRSIGLWTWKSDERRQRVDKTYMRISIIPTNTVAAALQQHAISTHAYWGRHMAHFRHTSNFPTWSLSANSSNMYAFIVPNLILPAV